MVKLNRIYTRSGDRGTTVLGSGQRVSKSSLRVDAYGTVDEANAAIGLAAAVCRRDSAATGSETLSRIDTLLRSIQQDLFDAGADLCTPVRPDEAPGQALRLTPAQTERLEREIDRYNAGLEPLNSFVLPGGTEVSAALHVARTVVRRAERVVASLREAEESATAAEPLRYLNRLSDLLFVLARVANDGGRGDELWVPGANRTAG